MLASANPGLLLRMVHTCGAAAEQRQAAQRYGRPHCRLNSAVQRGCLVRHRADAPRNSGGSEAAGLSGAVHEAVEGIAQVLAGEGQITDDDLLLSPGVSPSIQKNGAKRVSCPGRKLE